MKDNFKEQVLTDIFNCLLILAAGFIVTGSIFKPGILIAADNPMHFVEMHYLVKHFIPQGWVDGWCMQAPLGQPMLLYTYQLGGWCIAILNLLLKVELNLAYKIMVYVSYVFPGLALYIFLKERFGRTAGLFTTFLFLFQKVHINLLLGCVWNSYFAIGIFIVFLDILDRFHNDLNIKIAAILSILEGLIILGHPIAHFTSFMLIGSFLLADQFRPCPVKKRTKNIIYLILIPAAGSLIAFFNLYNLIYTKSWLVGFSEPWPNGALLANAVEVTKNIFGGLDRYSSLTVTFFGNISEILRSVLGVIGIGLLVRNREEKPGRLLWTIFLFAFFVFLIFSGIWNSIPVIKDLPVVKMMLNKRLIVYIHLALCIFVAFSTKFALDHINRNMKPVLDRKVIIFLAFAAIFVVSLAQRHIVINSKVTATTESVAKMSDIKKVWRWVNGNLDKNSRIIYQSTFGNSTGDPELDLSHIMDLGIYYTPFMHILNCGVGNHYPTYKEVDTASGLFLGKPVNQIKKDETTEKMNAFNARYVVTLEPVLEKKIAGLGIFKPIKKMNNFTIFECADYNPGWAYFLKNMPRNEYKIEKFEDDGIKINVKNSSDDNTMILKVAYHPYWEAYINGMRANLSGGPLGLSTLSLPVRGKFDIEFRYRSKRTIPVLISILSFIVCLIISILPRRARV